MKGQDLFGLILRVLGLLLLIYGLWYLWYAAGQAFGGYPRDRDDEAKIYLASGLIALFLGLIVIRGARAIVRFSYPGNREDSDKDEIPPRSE